MKSYHNPDYRQDFLLLFDVQDGNPNGDPDAGNLPRVDPETMQGLVTDVALKRKVRDWVNATRGAEGQYKIYVEHEGILNKQHKRAYEALGLEPSGTKQDRETVEKTRRWMCENFYDIRTFGAVMTTGVNCGQVRGPVQMTFARSVDPVFPKDLLITRVAVTTEEDAKVSPAEEEESGGKTTEMGRKAIIHYGLYRARGFFNPTFADDTGMDSEDLKLFWDALQRMWDLDRSASRGMVACRGLYIFSHKDKLGKTAAHKLFDRIRIKQRDDVDTPRSFNDYEVNLEDDELPEGVELHQLV